MNLRPLATPGGTPLVSVDEEDNDLESVIDLISGSGRPAMITSGGRIVAVISPVQPGTAESEALQRDPEFQQSLAEQEARMQSGNVPTRSLSEVAALLGRPWPPTEG